MENSPRKIIEKGTIEIGVYIVKFTTAYATFMKRGAKGEGRNKIVVGRDARISGDMVRNVVCGTLM
ncbi:hypothetical protein, partial [Alistipes sp.]|uniref:hypothetical protein n=1 Tax=Alistipes sp. TaxID=1872444 RepID=UPI0039C87A81